ncbi:MAG: response regulator [Elusimicrobiota bacterium]
MKILIVDDEEGIRKTCERALTQAGHQVSTCASGDDALPRLSEGWDLIVTDLTMPGKIDGNELVRRARAAGHADIAMMSAYATMESTIAALKDGACDYMLKPFSIAALLDLVRRREAGQAREASHPPQPISPRSMRMGTYLFADVRGFTSFSRTVNSEEAAERLDAMLACFIEAVNAEGGTIHKFMGDGAMAIFGLPLPHAEPAAGAARAALRAKAAVEKLGTLRFGFGINTGLAAAGSLGNTARAEYEVIGAPVNLAARLEAAAGPGQILIGADTRALLDQRFVVGEPRNLTLKGYDEPVPASELVGLK